MSPVQQFRCQSQGVPRREAFIQARFDKKAKRDVIRWESITQVFPEADFVLKNGVLVEYECDSDMEELVPRRIAAYPDEVLEVIVTNQEHRDKSQSQNSTNNTVTNHQYSTRGSLEISSVGDLVHQVNHLAIVEPGQLIPGSDSTEIVIGATASPINTQSLIKTLQAVANSGLQTIADGQADQTNRIIDLSSAIARGNGLQDALNTKQDALNSKQDELNSKQEIIIAKQDRIVNLQQTLNVKQDHIVKLQGEMKEMQEEMKEMQQQALDRLAIIQGRIQTVLTQNYELLEYPIPRLFIILPREPRFRDQFNPFTVPFKLYFLCECGSHTMGESTSTPHKIHIAKHEGYDIDQPTEFLEKYGSYILAILQMIKYGTAMATAVVPALAIADISEQVDLASESIKHIKENLNSLVDDAISILQSKIESADLKNGAEDQSEYNSIEALEGADLRQLESYLKNQDTARTLGNLYRIVTNEGHVKWVCLDHYRENYKEVTRKQLQEIVESNGGGFNENEGKVSIHLKSRSLARQFYDVLRRTRGVHDLDIWLNWDPTLDDLRQLETTVRVCNISILTLFASSFRGPASDMLNRGRRFDPLIDIMTNGRIQSFTLDYCPDFFKRISQIPQGGNSSTLQSLCLDGSDPRTIKDVFDLFSALPKAKHIHILGESVKITLSRTEGSSESTGGKGSKIRLSVCRIKADYWKISFGNWFNMRIDHFETEMQAISDYGLNRAFSRNQQLETLTLYIDRNTKCPSFLQNATHILHQLGHPLRILTLKCIYSGWTASINYDHGRITTRTLQDTLSQVFEIDGSSRMELRIDIDDKLSFGFRNSKITYPDAAGMLPIIMDAFPELHVHEIVYTDIDRYGQYDQLLWYLEISKNTLASITLKSSGPDWVSRLQDDEMRIGPFPNLSHFEYYQGTILTSSDALSTHNKKGLERRIEVLNGFLPLKSSQQTRQQKMYVELRNTYMGFGSWDRLLDSIDFQSIHQLKLVGCTIPKDILSVLGSALVGADLDLCIEYMRGVSPQSKDAFVESFENSSVRVDWKQVSFDL